MSRVFLQSIPDSARGERRTGKTMNPLDLVGWAVMAALAACVPGVLISTEPSWAWAVPLVNLAIFVFGVVFGLMKLKMALDEFRDKLREIATRMDKAEDRILRIKTVCEMMHPDQPADDT